MEVLVVGAGEWGRNHIRNYLKLPSINVTVCEPNSRNAEIAKKMFGVEIISDYTKTSPDAVSICTPASTHSQIAAYFLLKGIPTLVEKPLSLKWIEAQKLVDIAKKQHAVLMVGHTFRFDGGITWLAKKVKENYFGKVAFVSLSRMGFKNPREDCGVIFNYAVHDFDIMCNLFSSRFPDEVSTIMTHPLGRQNFEDFAIVSAVFGESFAYSQVSWLTPIKMREIIVVGEKRSAVLDPLKFEVEVFEQGIYPEYDSFGKYRLIKHEGKKLTFKVDAKEPLRLELEHFLECAKTNSEPITNGQLGADIVKICEAAIEAGKRKKSIFFDKNGDWR
ncbi:MAG: Gfo/Idh/MocA family oxidoreductase [Candidatus Anstonellales archaeon]